MHQDAFHPITLKTLVQLIVNELPTGRLFGIPLQLAYRPDPQCLMAKPFCGQTLATPIGVAAGPHTQLAPNIISAWLCGARYIELKTIQTLDQLTISKPCIDIQDEGYNCEWSQELRISDTIREYQNAWIVIHWLHHKLGLSGPVGTVFNMSVGYNLDGIKQPNVQSFFSEMADSSSYIAQQLETLSDLIPEMQTLVVPRQISNNVTLSTMHGCPPDEIEAIARYLIEEKQLHTLVKLNPTLLGPERLRHTLHTVLGYETRIPDIAFEHDLKYPDALRLIENLKAAATKTGVFFGVKLTNTLESVNPLRGLPENEAMVYMSGRALHAISIQVAAQLHQDFNGRLPISFCAGADCFNITDLLACGLFPVTVCSDLLKPGGYGRLAQYCTRILEAKFPNSSQKQLPEYEDEVMHAPRYHRNAGPAFSIKTKEPLGPFDCFRAPCQGTCPAHQDIPSYMAHAGKGNWEAALAVIHATNPFPNVLGQICNHACQDFCTRMNLDEAVRIRDVKRAVTQYSPPPSPKTPKPNGNTVTIIGAGPMGLSCAWYLALGGCKVRVLESKALHGGMLRDAIPTFRLDPAALDTDVDRILALGVTIDYNTRVTPDSFADLKASSHAVVIAVGAQAAKAARLPGDDHPRVLNPLHFLSAVRQGEPVALGENVLIIGGGNTAMDVARTAKRLVGTTGNVVISYRRTQQEMPADPEELEAALADGIEFMPLTTPVKITAEDDARLTLTLAHNTLSEPDASGRRSPVPIPDSEFTRVFSAIIPAVGQTIDLPFLLPEDRVCNPDTGETRIPGVFIGGDAENSGDTVVRAVADGHKIAQHILGTLPIPPETLPPRLTLDEHLIRRSRRLPQIPSHPIETEAPLSFLQTTRAMTQTEALQEAARCLYCDEFCGICATVCPNRAMRVIDVHPRRYPIQTGTTHGSTINWTTGSDFIIRQPWQLINLRNLCNECGNCATFCPTSGAPFQNKPGLYLTRSDFDAAAQGYFMYSDSAGWHLLSKSPAGDAILSDYMQTLVFVTAHANVILDPDTFALRSATCTLGKPGTVSLQTAAELHVILSSPTLREWLFQCNMPVSNSRGNL